MSRLVSWSKLMAAISYQAITPLFLGIAQALSKKYGSYPLPKSTMPKCFIWLFGPLLDPYLTRTYVSRNVNYGWKGDNSKGVRELSLTYRPLDETVCDIFQQMIDAKLF